MDRNPLELLNDIAQVIYDKKGSNILALDVRGLSSITDYLLIAEGNIDRHVTAMAKAMKPTETRISGAIEGQGRVSFPYGRTSERGLGRD